MRFNKNSTKYTLIVAAVVLVLFLLVFFSGRDSGVPEKTVTNENETVFSQIDKSHPPAKNYGPQAVPYEVYEAGNPPTVREAKINRRPLEAKVPHAIQFTASNGIKTSIGVSIDKSDPDYVIHVLIYGPIYQESLASEANPQAVAFKEAFEYLKTWLTDIGVDPYSLYYIFGIQEFDRNTSNAWVEYFGLL